MTPTARLGSYVRGCIRIGCKIERCNHHHVKHVAGELCPPSDRSKHAHAHSRIISILNELENHHRVESRLSLLYLLRLPRPIAPALGQVKRKARDAKVTYLHFSFYSLYLEVLPPVDAHLDLISKFYHLTHMYSTAW